MSQQTLQKDGPGASPAEGEAFASSALEKVQLDIDDAPFLQEEKSTPPAVREENAPAADRETPPKKSRKKLIIIIAAALVFAGAAAAAFLLFFGGEKTPPPQAPVIVVPGTPPPVLPTDYTVALEPFWVELRTPSNERVFLVAAFVLSTQDAKIHHEMEDKLVTLRDAIYYYLRNKDYAFLTDQNNMELIRTDLLSNVNNYIVQGELRDLWYDSYLIK